MIRHVLSSALVGPASRRPPTIMRQADVVFRTYVLLMACEGEGGLWHRSGTVTRGRGASSWQAACERLAFWQP